MNQLKKSMSVDDATLFLNMQYSRIYNILFIVKASLLLIRALTS